MDLQRQPSDSREPLDDEIAQAFLDSAPHSPAGPAHLLLVGANDQHLAELCRILAPPRYRCRVAASVDQALGLLAQESFDVVLLDADVSDADTRTLMECVRRSSPLAASKVVACSSQASFPAAVRAMRLGAVDFLALPQNSNELRARVDAAIQSARADRHREQRLTKLKSICNKLNSARHKIGDEMDSLCDDLVAAYEDMAAQVSEAAMASEFKTLLTQELDLEDLLRTALQYLLTKTGPTNGAVFLPDPNGHFSLGAYVNYDCPRESVAVLLEHLGAAVCPQMMDEDEIVRFDDAAEFADAVGMEAGVLTESQVIAFACRQDERCMAVIVLFRSKDEPFDEELVSSIEVLRPIFARQIASVIRIHHRAAPSWPKEAVDDDHDFNDGNDYGFGDLAA